MTFLLMSYVNLLASLMGKISAQYTYLPLSSSEF